jgi:hypothetical protein
MLDYIRVVTLSLAFFFLGLNLAVLKHKYDRPSLYATMGRVGFTVAVILTVTLKLLHKEFTGNLVFNLIVIPSLVLSIIGILKFYREQSLIEDKQESTNDN